MAALRKWQLEVGVSARWRGVGGDTSLHIGLGVEATRGGEPEHIRRECEMVCEVGELLNA